MIGRNKIVLNRNNLPYHLENPKKLAKFTACENSKIIMDKKLNKTSETINFKTFEANQDKKAIEIKDDTNEAKID